MHYALVATLALGSFHGSAPGIGGGYAGQWETTFGALTLRQEGQQITGIYADGSGSLSGKIDKNRIVFRFREPSGTGEGWFEFGDEGRLFIGKRKNQGSDNWEVWTGKRVDEQPKLSFAGLWNTTFGAMRLRDDGRTVQGMYALAGGSMLNGTVRGNRLAFRYREQQAEGEGWFDISDDGQSFHGKWRQWGATEWQDWQGSRAKPKPGRTWLIVIESNWEPNLSEHEYSFGNMLRAFFARSDAIQVRHRIFTDETSLRKWCRQIAFVAEPVVVVLASHGSAEGVQIGSHTVSLQTLADDLRHADIKLLHFSACEILKGKEEFATPGSSNCRLPFPVSGYTTAVDWAGSAIIEFTYLDMILLRGMSPAMAADQVRKLLPFSGDKDIPGAAIRAAGFRLLQPAK